MHPERIVGVAALSFPAQPQWGDGIAGGDGVRVLASPYPMADRVPRLPTQHIELLVGTSSMRRTRRIGMRLCRQL